MKYRPFLPLLICLLVLTGLLAACGEAATPTPNSMPLPNTAAGGMMMTTTAAAGGMMTMAPDSTAGGMMMTLAPAQQPLDVTPPSGPIKIIPGAMAPDFAVTDINGQPIKLSDQRGKAVLINYWSVYCDYCREEMPNLVKAYQANRDKLNIIGIDLNDQPGEVKDYISKLNITYPIVIDSTGDMVYKYRIIGRPTSIFINKDGVITGVVPGEATPMVLADQLGKVLK